MNTAQAANTTATTSQPTAAQTVPDFAAAKTRSKVVWSSGDYAVIGSTLQIVGETIAEAADVRSGETVLDVACGNGNAALAAGRRFARVTAIDYVPALLDRARARAAANAFDIETREADAETLPFGDETFDVVLSVFGVMFTPDQARAAGELARVCRRGGRIALACWTPDGFVGQMLKTVTRHVPAQPADALGHARRRRGVAGRSGLGREAGGAHLRLPLPVAGPLPPRVPVVLRSRLPRVRGAPAGWPGGAHRRPRRAARAPRHRRRPRAGGARDVPRDDRDALIGSAGGAAAHAGGGPPGHDRLPRP